MNPAGAAKELPRGWQERTLGGLCNVITDGTHYTPTYVERGIPFYSVESVTNDDFVNVKYISPEEHRMLVRRCRPQRGDILMTRIGSLAETKYLDWDVDASIYVSLALLRPGRQVDGRYLYSFTKSRWFVKAVEDRSLLWAAPKKINMGDISHVPVLLPIDPDEQRAIADVSFTLEDQVNMLERLIAKKQVIKQGVMQQLLTGRTRLPGFTSRWINASLGDVATLQRGFDLPTRLRRRGIIPIVSSAGVSGWHDHAMVKGPGVITGRYGTIGEVFFETVDFWPLNTTLWVSAFHGNNVRFIYYLLQRVDFASHSGKSGVPGVNRNDLHSELVSLPDSVAEQQAIAKALDDAEAELAVLRNRLSKAHSIKISMMQQLLTGRTRLPVQETTA